MLLSRIIKSKKIRIPNLINMVRIAIFKKPELLFWASSGRDSTNFGDALNPWLFKKIMGYAPINASETIIIFNNPVFSCIGSILGWSRNRNLVIWGSGFISEDSFLRCIPKRVCAIRGPLTRKKLLEFGVECPEVYGDPALLLPKYYSPKIVKKYRIGIVPHYIDKDNPNFINLCKRLPCDVSIIDLEQGVETAIDSILECEKIISSSLHGLIVADAYGIPSLRVKFSDNVAGGDFKFNDYFLSVGRRISDPIIIDQSTTLEYLLSKFRDYTISIDLDLLLEVCPFRSSK